MVFPARLLRKELKKGFKWCFFYPSADDEEIAIGFATTAKLLYVGVFRQCILFPIDPRTIRCAQIVIRDNEVDLDEISYEDLGTAAKNEGNAEDMD
jgi:hypothetical protein